MRSRELPLVDMATAMSPGPARAMSWRANTRSKPTSLPSAVRIAWSAASDQRRERARRPAAARTARRGWRRRWSCRRCRTRTSARPRRTGAPSRRRPSRSAPGWRPAVDARSAALSAALAAAEAARSRSRASWSRSSASRKGYRKFGHAVPPARSRCPRGRAGGRRARTGSTSSRLDVLDARRAVRTRPRPDHLAEPPLVGAGDADLVGALRGSVEQAGVLEADVGELPQQVVEQHEAAGGGHQRVGVVEPEHVVGGARVGPGAAADPDRRGAPGRGPPHDRADVRVGRGGDGDARGRRAGPRSGRWRRGRAR